MAIQPKDIKTQLVQLLENDLRIKIVMPLIIAKGAYKVLDWHGRNEKGKDVYFAYKDLFGDYKHCCIFIKAGDVTKSGQKDIRKMKGAIDEALFSKFDSPMDNHSPVYIEEFYFACNGTVNDDARSYLSELFHRRQFPNFKIYDIDRITEMIRDLIRSYSNKVDKSYIFDCDGFEGFCKRIMALNDKQIDSQISATRLTDI